MTTEKNHPLVANNAPIHRRTYRIRTMGMKVRVEEVKENHVRWVNVERKGGEPRQGTFLCDQFNQMRAAWLLSEKRIKAEKARQTRFGRMLQKIGIA